MSGPPKLSFTPPTNYLTWREQMLALLKNEASKQFGDLSGFVDPNIQCPPESVTPDYTEWKKKDRIVKELILNFIHEDLALTIEADQYTAKNLWVHLEDKFENYQRQSESVPHGRASAPPERLKNLREFQKAVQEGEWRLAEETLDKDGGLLENPEKDQHVTDIHHKILLVSIMGKQNNVGFIDKLVKRMPDEPLAVQDENGSLLHAAASAGNKAAAEILVKRKHDLLYYVHDAYLLPIHTAAVFYHRGVLEYLKSETQWNRPEIPFAHDRGLVELFCRLVDAEFFDIALDLVSDHKRIAITTSENNKTALSHMANAMTAFTGGGPGLRLWESFLNTCGFPQIDISSCFKNAKRKQALELVKLLCNVIKKSDAEEKYSTIYEQAILKAANLGSHDVVEAILEKFPHAIMCVDTKTRHSIFHLAIINRSEHVFNLIYGLGEPKRLFSVMLDHEGNNMLHLAAKSAPSPKLSAQASGAVLQMQHEIQWYKKVEKVVSSCSKWQQNIEGKTPVAIFMEKHKGLKDAGEKWMKETAKSCSVVAVLITSIMFAAAIQVPGGSNGTTGIPVFIGEKAFLVFATADAISLFASATSLLLFLSISTSRFTQEAFLWKHPTKLIFALQALYISIGSVMVAFTATIFLVLGKKERPVLVQFSAIACFAGTSFMLLQLRPFGALIFATSGLGLKMKMLNSITRNLVAGPIRPVVIQAGQVINQAGQAINQAAGQVINQAGQAINQAAGQAINQAGQGINQAGEPAGNDGSSKRTFKVVVTNAAHAVANVVSRIMNRRRNNPSKLSNRSISL